MNVRILLMRIAYGIEKKRQELASKDKLEDLKKLYSSNLPEIKNLNTPGFWDKIYSENLTLGDQDSMTRDRIKTAVNFISKRELKILDIGAGMGFIEELIIKEKDKEIYANDFSEVSVAYLKKNFKGRFSKQSIYKLEYPQKFFDVILVLEILEHIPPSKIFKVLKSISKLLKSNGTLIVSVPMNEGLENMKYNPSGHVRMYSKDLIKAELEIAGFKVIEYKTLFAFNNLYKIKTAIAKVLKTHKPNNIILKARKT